MIEKSHCSIKRIAAREMLNHGGSLLPDQKTTPSFLCPLTWSIAIKSGEHQKEDMLYKIGDCMWVKNPHNQCTLKYQMGHVASISNLHATLIDRILCHLKAVGSTASESDTSSTSSTSYESANIYGAPNGNLNRGNSETEPNEPCKSSESEPQEVEEIVHLQLSTRIKKKKNTLNCHICNHHHEIWSYRRKWWHTLKAKTLLYCMQLLWVEKEKCFTTEWWQKVHVN